MLVSKSVHGFAFRSLRSRLVVGQRSALSFTTSNPDAAGIHTAVEDGTSTSTSKQSKLASFGLSASRLGLDPLSNRFHGPIVNHENYSFSDWPANHTFPVRITVPTVLLYYGSLVDTKETVEESAPFSLDLPLSLTRSFFRSIQRRLAHS
jgi:hypothetical protein